MLKTVIGKYATVNKLEMISVFESVVWSVRRKTAFLVSREGHTTVKQDVFSWQERNGHQMSNLIRRCQCINAFGIR